VETLPLTENLTWAFNQPDNKNGADDCLQMRLMQNNTGIALLDRNCSDKFVIACEVNHMRLKFQFRCNPIFIGSTQVANLLEGKVPEYQSGEKCDISVDFSEPI